MGACNKSDGRQYSKNKPKFEAQQKRNSWATQKAKAVARHDRKKQDEKGIDRGARRRARRASVNWGEVNQRRHDNGNESVRWQDYAQS